MCHGLQNRHELKLKGFYIENPEFIIWVKKNWIWFDIIFADHCTFIFDMIITFC